MRKNDDCSVLIRCLARINQHLKDMDTIFMVGDKMARADAYLIPTVQHIRVAGNVSVHDGKTFIQ